MDLIVRDKAVHQKVLENVTDFALNYGFIVKGLDFSPIAKILDPFGLVDMLI